MLSHKEFEVLRNLAGKNGISDAAAYVYKNTYFDLFWDEAEVAALVDALAEKSTLKTVH